MIKRTLLEPLKAHVSLKEISFIVGPRQAGKTTVMYLLKDWLEKNGERTLFLNLDIESDKQFFTTQAYLVKKIELELGKHKGFVFIDEIQRKEDAGIFLKGIYDMNLPYKFIVSGSGSVELKERIHESLTGRKRIFELGTLSFEEFVNHRTDYRYYDKLSDFFIIEKEKMRELFSEYLNFGGYPRVVLAKTQDEKHKIIDEIYQSYLERDISYLVKVKKTDAFSNLIKSLSSQIGRTANFRELSSTLGLSVITVKEYLWFLEKTFIIAKVTPYFRNVRKEIVKSPVFYFHDIGMRNFAIGLFGNVVARNELGFLFQNFIFNDLKSFYQRTAIEVHFWRTKDKAEVDFVISTGRELIPIETKYKEFTETELTRSLRSFIDKYNPARAIIVNLELEKALDLNKTKVYFIPFYKLNEYSKL